MDKTNATETRTTHDYGFGPAATWTAWLALWDLLGKVAARDC